MAFPCDAHLPDADDSWYRAVTVDAPPAVMFRWLCQIKAAPYSYDWIDNRGRRSPQELVPGLEQLTLGERVLIFRLVEFEPDRHLTIALWGSAVFGDVVITYLVVPDAEQAGRCRLVAKLLVRSPGPAILRPAWLRLFALGDLAMMRRQLLNLKALAERHAPAVTRHR